MWYMISILIVIGLILVIALTIYSPPRCVIIFISKIYPDVLFHVHLPSTVRCIALTIDDFPNPDDISISFRILDTLRLHGVRCTFFTIGSHVDNYERSLQIQLLFQRLITDGHEIGNHGWRDEKAISLSQNELQKQIIDTENTITNYVSLNEKWFRPGSGFFNQTMIQICDQLGYRLALGSIYPHDPQIRHPRLNSYFIEHKLYPGAIIILHDRLATIETLERVLPAIKRRGYCISTLTGLTKINPNQ